MVTQTISSLLEEIKEAMCDDYCRYPREWNREAEGMELDESDICSTCPLRCL